jgi:hypothetical protein
MKLSTLLMMIFLFLSCFTLARAAPTLQCDREALKIAHAVYGIETGGAIQVKFILKNHPFTDDEGNEEYHYRRETPIGESVRVKILMADDSDGKGCVLASYTRATSGAGKSKSCRAAALAISQAVYAVTNPANPDDLNFSFSQPSVFNPATQLKTFTVQGLLKSDETAAHDKDRQIVLFEAGGCELTSYTVPDAN